MSSVLENDPPFDPATVYKSPMVEFTQSALSTYTTCPQKYVLRYLMQIVPQGVSVPLVVGTAVHAAFEFILDPKNAKLSLRDRMIRVDALIDKPFDDAVEKSDAVWLINSDKLEHGRAQAHAVVKAWSVVNDPTTLFKVLHTELNIRSKDGATTQSPWQDRMAGKIDGVVIALHEDSTVRLLEHKTRFSLKDLDFLSGLSLDHQAMWYLIMYNNWIKDKKNAKKVKSNSPAQGFFYDAIAKPMHRTGDTFDELVDRMYTAMVEKSDQYFSLTPVEVEVEAIERAERNCAKLVDQVDNLSAKTVVTHNHACNLYGGCPYRKLCSAGADVSDPGKVLSLPQLDMYAYAGRHSELGDVIAEEAE